MPYLIVRLRLVRRHRILQLKINKNGRNPPLNVHGPNIMNVALGITHVLNLIEGGGRDEVGYFLD